MLRVACERRLVMVSRDSLAARNSSIFPLVDFQVFDIWETMTSRRKTINARMAVEIRTSTRVKPFWECFTGEDFLAGGLTINQSSAGGIGMVGIYFFPIRVEKLKVLGFVAE